MTGFAILPMGKAMHGTDFSGGLPRLAFYGFGALVCLGIGAFLAGVMAQPTRTWANLLVVSYYLLGVGLGGAVLLALFWVTGARWSRRHPARDE